MEIDDDYYNNLKWNVVRAFSHLGFIRIPVDPVELMESAGIRVIPYSEGIDMWDQAKRTMSGGCPSGISFTLHKPDGTTERFACYNNYEPATRNRFTESHEAGHCFLGHKADSRTAEREANFWARYAIAPPVLIHRLQLSSGEEVAKEFGLSQECAGYAYDFYLKWLRHRKADKAIDDAILRLYDKGLMLDDPKADSPLDDSTIELLTGKGTPAK